jgi:cell fate regulator YaaT (PSP1 superfamily)
MAKRESTSKVVGVRFNELGKLYHFDASNVPDVKPGDYVIVSTSRGRELGQVVNQPEKPPRPSEGSWKKVERSASARELVMQRIWQKREQEVLDTCRAEVEQLGLEGVKIPKAEYSYDGSRLTFFYHIEGDEKIDLKKLHSNLRKAYRGTRIELRQIGPRDMAKILGGLGACGLETRCCSLYMTEFSPISIRMAKAQSISLNPEEITGMCGRLRCCLLYEYKLYVEARKNLPKRKKRVLTPMGEGKVIDVLALKKAVIVQMEDGRNVEFSADEIEPYEELKNLEAKAQQSCKKNENGGCDCVEN